MSSEQPDVCTNNSDVGENGQPLTEAEIKAKKNKKKKERAKRKKAAAKEAAAAAASGGGAAAATTPSGAGKSKAMDNSSRSAPGKNAKNKNATNNNNKNNNKSGATNGAANGDLTAKLAAKEAELAQAQQVIADLVSKGKGLEKDNTKLQEDVKKFKNEIQAMETAMVQMKSTQTLPDMDGSSTSDDAAQQIKALQAELAKTKESFAKDKIQLEENLKLAHKAQMEQAMAQQKTLQEDLQKARSSSTTTTTPAAASASGNGVEDVWQTKCVATAKQLKDEKKYVVVLEAEKKELEKQLEFATKESKPWWMCG